MLLTISAAAFVIGVLIFVHELGHFIAAKSVGIGVHRFSLGLGPLTPLKFQWGETEYVVSWIPFGGYVKMASKEEQDEAMGSLEGGAGVTIFPDDKLFESKPLWARIFVISAGVAMNFAFAWFVYFALATTLGRIEDPTTVIASIVTTSLPESGRPLGALPNDVKILRINGDTIGSWNDVRDHIADPTSESLHFEFLGQDPILLPIDGFSMDDRVAVFVSMIPRQEARVGAVSAGSAADEAGFETGDLVIAGNGAPLADWAEMVVLVRASMNDTVAFLVRRGSENLTLTAVPKPVTVRDPETGEETQVGQLGVNRNFRQIRVGLLAGFGEGTRGVLGDAQLILATLEGLVTRKVAASELGGPVLIGQISGQVAAQGLVPLLRFMALFSVNLAILNLLPIPVLDGGHLIFLLIEGVRGGRPISTALRVRFTQFGLVILLGIMALALTNDLRRVFGL